MPLDVFAQTGAGALRFEDDANGDKYKKFGKALQKLQRSLNGVLRKIMTRSKAE